MPNGETDGHRGGKSGGADDSLSFAVLNAVATEESVDVDHLPPIGEVLNPDALDALFAPRPDGTPRQGGQVIFEFYGHIVSVDADGQVAVE